MASRGAPPGAGVSVRGTGSEMPIAGMAGLLAMADRLAIGIVLLDDAGAVLFASRCARRILHAEDGLLLRAGRLAATARGDDERLKALLCGSITGGCWRAAAIGRDRRSRPLSVVVGRLEPESSAAAGPQPSRVVLIGDAGRPCTVPEAVLMSLYGLTQREAALTNALLRGDRLPGAAAQLGIAVGTARAYLKTIFAKTDTRNQAELIGLVLRQAGWIDYSQPASGGNNKA